MSNNGCPIVLSLLRSVRKKTEEESLDHLSIGLLGDEDWDALEESAKEPIGEDTIRLRAFYAFELLYYEILHRMLHTGSFTVTGTLDGVRIGPLPVVERSSSGLTALIASAESLKKRLSAQASISLIKRDRTNASVQWAAINEAACAVIPWICEAADILLGCLRRGDIQRIGTIGTLLAQGMEAAHYTTSDLELEVRTLLNISKENASAPWQRKKHPSPA